MSSRAAPVHALVIVDAQKTFVAGDGAVPDCVRVVAALTDLLERARAAVP